MKPIPPRFLRSLWCSLLVMPFLVAAAAAQTAVGTIEGQISNSARGEHVERARVTVDGTLLETFTQPDGSYRLSNVPAGSAVVRTFFTGFPTHVQTVAVTAGQTARHDVDLGTAVKTAGTARDAEIVKLSEFLVSTSREMDAAA